MDNLDKPCRRRGPVAPAQSALERSSGILLRPEEIETVEAFAQGNLRQHVIALRTYTRIYDDFDLFANLN
jgi:hypothetical protein